MRKIVVPLNIISKLGQFGLRELLIANGFNTTEIIISNDSIEKFTITYTQAGDK